MGWEGPRAAQHRTELALPGVVTPATFEPELRRIRFDDNALERSFRDEHEARRAGELPLFFWVGLAIQVPISFRFAFIEHIGPDNPLFWLRLAVGVLPAVGGLLLLRSPEHVRWTQPYLVFYVLLIGATLVIIYAETTLGWAFLSTYLIAACIMGRLRAREAALVSVVLLAWYAFYATVAVHKPAGLLAQSAASTITSVVFIVGAAYLIERSARRDFVLVRLLAQEREKSERLLLNVLPAPIAERLKEAPGTVADSFDQVTVLFADIVDSAPHIAQTSPEQAVELLNGIFTTFDALSDRHGLEKIKTVGDAYMVVGGLPEPRPDHAAAVVAMAVDMLRAAQRFRWPDGELLRIRIGVHTGPVVAGVIGTRKFAYDLWGDTVNVASRMESHGVPGAIQLTEATRRQLSRRYRFAERVVDVKGKGPMSVHVLQPVGTRPRQKVLAGAAGA